MTARLTLICHGSTQALRAAAFPGDEPLDEKGLAATAALVGRLGRADHVLVSPALRTRQTAEALLLDAVTEPALRECGYGRWQGRGLSDIAAEESDAMAAWMSDPEAAPHGGESVADLTRRVGAWLDGRSFSGHTISITHASVLRAAAIHALGAPAMCFWRIDAAPLSVIDLRRNDRHWTLRAPAL